ncbi:MAG: hypothetical protein NVSMB65_08800 [Chloroflexota bacterium]
MRLVPAAVVPSDLFRGGAPIIVARAPARLDVMGGIADYSGATVLEWPLAEGVYVAIQEADDGMMTARTLRAGASAPIDDVRVPISVLHDGMPSGAPRRLRAALASAGGRWAAYVLGPLALLAAEGRAGRLAGLRLSVWSDVPVGAGVSSSAALEVAALRAVAALLEIDLDPLRLALLCQSAEHQVAGAPCGIMDQVTVTMGRRDHLLVLRCQPATVLGHRRLPREVHVAGIDSGVAHRVGGGQYGRVRAAAFMGRAIIAAHTPGEPPGGYLCNLTPERFTALYAPLLPETLTGADFLARYGTLDDNATEIVPQETYHVRSCTAHPVHEQANGEAFLASLDRYEATGSPADLDEAAAAMDRSHASYGARCGLGTPETDLLVSLVRQRKDRGLLGAKITGGGAGGTVAVLGVGPAFGAALDEVAGAYAQRSGHVPRVLAGSSEGALAWPLRRFTRDERGDLDVF